jgi:dihydrofolate reductase
MAKLYSFNMVTLNGFFEGPTPWSIEWHNVDDEFNTFAIDQLSATGALVFGRKTYEGMAAYWPSPQALESDPQIAEAMNRMPKLVVSRTLERADWNNTRLVKDDMAGEISRLKQQADKDVALFGSANLMATLMRQDLVDEHRLIVNPIVLATGAPVFQGFDGQLKLKLMAVRQFGNGNVLLTYQPA